MLLTEWRSVPLCVQRALNECRASAQVSLQGHSLGTPQLWSSFITSPRRDLGLILSLFLCALKMRKSKRPQNKCHPKFLAFHLENQELGLSMPAAPAWANTGQFIETKLNWTPFPLKPPAAQFYHFLGMFGSKLFKFLIKIWRNKNECQSMYLISFATLHWVYF